MTNKTSRRSVLIASLASVATGICVVTGWRSAHTLADAGGFLTTANAFGTCPFRLSSTPTTATSAMALQTSIRGAMTWGDSMNAPKLTWSGSYQTARSRGIRFPAPSGKAWWPCPCRACSHSRRECHRPQRSPRAGTLDRATRYHRLEYRTCMARSPVGHW